MCIRDRGCEPYVSGNVGSGTVEELAKWVEYMTSDGDSPMANPVSYTHLDVYKRQILGRLC